MGKAPCDSFIKGNEDFPISICRLMRMSYSNVSYAFAFLNLSSINQFSSSVSSASESDVLAGRDR
jgi:hypothetical protein